MTAVTAWASQIAWALRAPTLAVLALAGVALAVAATRWVRSVGVRAGRAAERAAVLRLLHDTVLQTLEGMALAAEREGADPVSTVDELRRAARGQATALRRSMAELAAGRDGARAAGRGRGEVGDLGTDLAALVDRYAGLGLRVEPVLAGRLPEPAPERRAALCAAAGAALGNVARHAGVDRAVLRVEPDRGGLRMVVRDQGVGFDPARTAAGFGTDQSLHARLHEVGGRASVAAAPGRGTRVELWVPA